ncbi:MAG: hypothetical protein AAF503_07995 [Pseudomonadota bacterium]
MKKLFFPAVLTTLAACAGDPRAPADARQPGDETLSCEQIAQERQLNEERMTNLARQKAVSGAGNFGTSIFNPSARRLSDGEQAEIDKLDLRNQWLNELGGTKGCG